MTDIKNSEDLYPIGTVSEMTGVNSVTLRAWERRYGLIRPQRTPKGHRLYSREDISLIESILEYLERGLSISKVTEQIRRQEEEPEYRVSSDTWDTYREKMHDAIRYFDESVLDAIYNEAMSLYPVDVVTRNLIQPLLVELGERWTQAKDDASQVPVAEEHFFSVFIRNKLGARFHHRNIQNNGPKLVTACLPGEHHEFGLLLFALAAHARGYRLVPLGSDMPLNELSHVVERTAAGAIVLSGSDRLSCMEFNEGLRQLTNNTPVPVFIGGETAPKCSTEVQVAGAIPIGVDLIEGLKLIKHTLDAVNNNTQSAGTSQ